MIADIARLSLNKVCILSRKLICADRMKNEKYADFDISWNILQMRQKV